MLKKNYKEFRIFHQPKTAGTYCIESLKPFYSRYVLPHNINYNLFLRQKISNRDQILPVNIVRDPLDFYISLISFWLLDNKYTQLYDINLRNKKYLEIKHNKCGHLGIILGANCGNNVEEILENIFSDDFNKNHQEILSKQFHTYDCYVFNDLERLSIGLYTWMFLDQFSRKKVNEIASREECFEEMKLIKKNFYKLETSTIESCLKKLCELFNIKNNYVNYKPMSTNRKKKTEYNFSLKLLDKIYSKDEFLYTLYFS